MRLRVDAASDAVYLDLTAREIESSEEVSEGIILDYDRDGHLVGVEILDASRKSGDLDLLKNLSLDVPSVAA
jgi:uncharacterized protein YuzE